MYSYDEYIGLIEGIKKIYFKYRDSYENLYVNINAEIKNKLQIRSRKSIHNIDSCPRPNLASLVKEFEFSDEGYWVGKKQNSYTCYLNKQGRVIMTTVGITQFVELCVNEDDGVYLLGYEHTEYGYKIRSIGRADYENNNIIKSFTVMEITDESLKGMNFVLTTEEYGYDDKNLLNIILYRYNSADEITVFDKSAPVKQLWYNETASGDIYANPSIFVRKFIYEDGVLKRATSRDMYNNKSKVFIHKII